jgi:hypothetical protein
MVALPLAPRATFSGESGSRNPGVTVTVELEVEPVPAVSVAVTFTCTLLAVMYGGGVYWPLFEIDPGPEFVSPPLTAQVTEAAPPLFSVAVNCSTACPKLELALQPVQLVSIETVPGDTEKVPFELPEAVPPQPARRTKTGTAAATSTRAGQCRGKLDGKRWPLKCKPGLCGFVVTAVPWLNLRLNLSGAFLASFLRNPC